MVRPDGPSIPVLLRAHPEDSVTPQLRKDGRLLSQLDDPGILGLLHITRASGHPLSVYEGFEGVSMERVLQVLSVQGEHLPIRTCLDLVTAAAEGMRAGLGTQVSGQDTEGLPVAVVHAGAAPSELLVDASGEVKLAGFSIQRGTGEMSPSPTGYGPPVKATPEADAVYGLGALLVQLLSGEAPAAGSEDPERQGAILRRALIRVLARPGDAAGDEVIALIRRCLGLDLAQRPDLEALIPILKELSTAADDAGLEAWAPVKISVVLRQQDTGYPSEEESHQRRYVDPTSLHSDEASFETPPVRRPPREQPTLISFPGQGLSVAVGTPDTQATHPSGQHTAETEPAREARDVMPSADLSISLPMPEALLGHGPQVDIDAGAGGPEGDVHLDIQPDDWLELDSPTQARRTTGWIMVFGVLAGMVLASLVAWVLVDRLGGPTLLGGGWGTGPAEVDAMQTGAAADALADEADKPVAEQVPPPDAMPVEEPMEAAEVPQDPVPPGAPVQVQAPPPPAQLEPAPLPVAEARPVQEEARPVQQPGPDRFTVSFRSVDPSVTRMVVRCHIGKGSGTGRVQIANAGPGPCKVIGFRGESERLVVSAVLTGARSFSCFRNGARVCE